MNGRRHRSRDELQAIFAALGIKNQARFAGRNFFGRKLSKKEKVQLRAAANRQKATQRFIKMVDKKGVLAHPNTLIKGNFVWKLQVDLGRKSIGPQDRWVKGRVTSKGTYKGSVPAVKIRWENSKTKSPEMFTPAKFKAMSIIQFKKRGTKKTGAQLSLEKSINARRKELILERTRGLRELEAEMRRLGHLKPKKRKKRKKG